MAATLAKPAAIAYDAAGNLYIADANNHVIREIVKASGTISTIAGTGIAGFSGDGGSATSAQLDTPTGIAVDASGNVYIADSHNHRLRKVTGGTISTIAGTGSAGFSGDGGAATSAQLSLPSAVAVDTSGNLYIADTNNQRVRKITGATISTIAGTGDQGNSGDGAAATAATLDSPTGIAVDASGNVFLADRHNQRVREIVASSGSITTVAGSGTVAFGGGYSGEGVSAIAAMLANPTGVSIDANGNLLIADTNNQRVRQVSNGAIATVAGTGAQDFTGDGSAPVSAALNTPRAVTTDASGNLAIADTLNQRVRAGALGSLTFASTAVGIASAAQAVTLANTGTAPITISAITFIGPFVTATGGTCSSAPITLAAGASCTQNIAFLPTVFGAATGSVAFSGTGVVTQSVLLSGTATQGTTTTTLASSNATPFINELITFTATVNKVGGGTAPTGTVTFYLNGTTQIGLPQTVTATQNTASVQTTIAAAGSYAITAVYSGDTNYTGSTGSLTQAVGDFSFTIIPDPSNPGGSVNQTVQPGKAAIFNFTVAPMNGPFVFPITLSTQGLPPGATVTFTPNPVTLGASSATFTMTVQTAATTGMLQRLDGFTGTTMAFLLLLVPFGRRRRGRGRTMQPLMLLAFALGGLGTLSLLTGCGTGSGFFGQPQKTYTIQVIGTATDTNGATLQHATTVQLTIQ